MGATAAKKSGGKPAKSPIKSTKLTPVSDKTAIGGAGVESARRGTHFFIDVGTLSKPKGVMLVTDPKHYLYDPRVADPPSADKMASLLQFGVTGIIRLVKEDGQFLVEDGRDRIKGIRTLNEGAREGGYERILAKVEVSKATEERSRGVVMTSNVHKAETPATLIPKIEQYLAQGHTDKEAADASGQTLSAIRQIKACFGLHPTVLKAVKDAKLALTAGAELAKLPKDEQVAQLGQMVAAGTATVAEVQRRRREKATGKAQPSRYASRASIDAAYERLHPYATGEAALPEGVDLQEVKRYHTALSWFRGERVTAVEDVLDALPKVKKEKTAKPESAAAAE